MQLCRRSFKPFDTTALTIFGSRWSVLVLLCNLDYGMASFYQGDVLELSCLEDCANEVQDALELNFLY